MKSLPARIGALLAALAIFGFALVVIAARPWTAEARIKRDPRLVALENREKELQQEAKDVQRAVSERWAEYRQRLKKRERAIAAAQRKHRQELARAKLAAARAAATPRTVYVGVPVVQVVSLPPVSTSKSS